MLALCRLRLKVSNAFAQHPVNRLARDDSPSGDISVAFFKDFKPTRGGVVDYTVHLVDYKVEKGVFPAFCLTRLRLQPAGANHPQSFFASFCSQKEELTISCPTPRPTGPNFAQKLRIVFGRG